MNTVVGWESMERHVTWEFDQIDYCNAEDDNIWHFAMLDFTFLRLHAMSGATDLAGGDWVRGVQVSHFWWKTSALSGHCIHWIWWIWCISQCFFCDMGKPQAISCHGETSETWIKHLFGCPGCSEDPDLQRISIKSPICKVAASFLVCAGRQCEC